MKRKWLLASACAAALGVCMAGSALAQSAAALDRGKAQVSRSASGRALTAPSQAAPGTIVRGWLRSHGASTEEIASLREAGRSAGANGVTHLRLEQQVDGLTIHGAYVKAAINARGELVQVINKLASVSTPAASSIGPRQALDAALANLYPGLAVTMRQTGASGNATRFDGDAYFHGPQNVTAVALALADGSLARGWRVETWSEAKNQLNHTLVDGQGRIVSVQNRTATESYNVFPEDPGKGPQSIVVGPGAGNAQSPTGWLGTGTQLTVHIFGNNADAYLDTKPFDNAPDRGGSAVTGGNFLAVANLAQSPTTTGNKAVAVQNLFYLNNRLHDILYAHGFNAAAGNFQVNNFGNGGLGGDPVQAEAQDGSGTDNANFSTPLDGNPPRMQMYLFSSPFPTHELVINSPIAATYGAMGAQFGKALTTTGISGAIVKAVPADGCAAITSPVAGAIALIDRGGSGICDFSRKAVNAQNAGAKAVVIANNVGGNEIFVMGAGFFGRNVRIPAIMISQDDGAAAKSLTAPAGTARKKAVQSLQLDSALDSDIVYHEYGHGLSWRMIGDMDGPLAGAIGEGNSDGIAMLINGDDLLAEYIAPPTGLRRNPYTDYPRTYANVTGDEVHDDGEIYGAIVWRMIELYDAAGLSRYALFTSIVDGMNYTPSRPAWEDMRDGILASISNSGTTQQCEIVWQAFTQFGVGDGAQGVESGFRVTITPSFTPGTCP